MSDQEQDQDEEKVVCEIPVYLCKTLSKKLYLVQYPQRPATMPIKESEIIETKMKPSLNKIQLTMGIDTDSEYYDEFHGELLAEAAEGLGLNEDEYIPDARRKIEKTILESVCHPKLTNSSRYVAGVVKEGAVHLTPMNSVIQMKPTLPFLNKADKARAKHENAGVDTEDEGDEEAQKVTVKFKRTPMDPNKPTTNKSSFSARKKEEEEPWVTLDYTENNKEVLCQLCTPNMDNDEPMYVLTQKDYLIKLFPKHVETVIDGSDKSIAKNHVLPKIHTQKMKDMTLAEQLKVLILNGKVMRYDQIVEFMKTRLRLTVDDTTLLRTLQTVSALVQGCWVARSEVLYPDDFKSQTNGVPGPIMQAARDTVLSFFTENSFVERRKLAPILHLPDEEIVEILSNISQRVFMKGWEFLLPYDHSFVSRYPDVVQRQNMIWEVKNQHRERRVSESSKDSSSVLKPPSKSPPRRRHSRTISCSSDNESGTEPESRGRRGSGGTSGRQRRPSSRSGSEPTLLGVPSKVES